MTQTNTAAARTAAATNMIDIITKRITPANTSAATAALTEYFGRDNKDTCALYVNAVLNGNEVNAIIAKAMLVELH